MTIKRIDDFSAAVSGRIDSSNAQEFESGLMALVPAGCADFCLDAEGLDYISSAGLRVLMKLRKSCSGSISILNVSDQVWSVLEMTGFSQLFNVKKAYRRISIDGCPVIGKGFYGTVYRIDADTIVKVYSTPDSIPLIVNEQKMAKAAFIKGIPTAISYDIVKVGDSYGSVFEMLKAKSFNDLVIENPKDVDSVVKRWSDLLKQVHSTEMDSGEVPSCRARFIDYLDVIAPYLDEGMIQTLKELLLSLPDSRTIVHGDYQMKNVLLSDDEPMLIDMDTLALGHPVFDFAGLYVTYQQFEEDAPGNSMAFLGIPFETSTHIWNKLFEYYFGPVSEDKKQQINDSIKIVALVRFLFILAVSDLKNGELGARRIAHAREHLEELLTRVEKLGW